MRLRPIHDPYDDNSTEAPDEDDRLFDREEALRHDDAIMDFQWFSTVSWSDIKDLRGTTYVQPPARFRFALQQAQHAILRAIMHHGPSSTQFRTSWEGTNPQQVAPPRPTRRKRVRRQLCQLNWGPDWTSSGPKIGPPYGPWFGPNCKRCDISSDTLEDKG